MLPGTKSQGILKMAGGCGNSIAGKRPSPDGNLPSVRYLTHCSYSLQHRTYIVLLFAQKSKQNISYMKSSLH